MKRVSGPVGWCLLALGLVLVAGCDKIGDKDKDAGDEKVVAATVRVRTETIARRAFHDEVVAPGQWHSSGEVVLPAPFPAAIESLEPRVGDHVRAGQTLGVLVTRESRATLRGAELLVREAQDDVARAEAQRALTLAKRGIIRVPLLAPRAGVITRRVAEPGAEVAEGADLLGLTPEDAMVFEARVPAAQIAHVHAGQSATITEDGVPVRNARVQRILPAASTTDQAVLVWLRATGGPSPMLDHFGTAVLTLGAERSALAVPAAAVAEDDLDATTRVAVVDANGEAVWVVVKLGAAVGGWREVLGGELAQGAKVIVEGQHGLPDHTKVAVAP